MDLQGKANAWEQALRKGFIPRSLAWTALLRVIWPSLSYSLAVTSFSESQALAITSRLYRTLLPRLGVNRHYPVALRHAPTRYHGLGLPHPYWEQGVATLKLFLEFMNTSQPEQSLLLTLLELLQLEVGISSPILQADFHRWGVLATDCWVKSLWRFVWAAEIQVISTSKDTFRFQRQGDACIMDKIATFNLPPSQLAAFNRCCMSHQVFFLLDIMDGWGHSLRDSLLSPPTAQVHSSWLWPQASRAKADWVIWQRILPHLAANTVLDNWFTPPHLQHYIPFDPDTSTAYILHPGQYWQTYCLALPWTVR